MKQPVLILQQVEYEPAALIEQVIHDQGWETHTIHTMESFLPQALSSYSGLVIMGGYMSANDLQLSFVAKQVELLKWCIRYNFPVLGICLGAQMLAKAAGSKAIPSPVRELGWYPLRPAFSAVGDPLFGDIIPNEIQVLQWHGETFDLPAETTLLATCPDVINQSFRIKSKLYGLQFHTEMTEEMIHDWLKHGISESTYLGETGIKQLLDDIPKYLPLARKFCNHMVSAWTKLL